MKLLLKVTGVTEFVFCDTHMLRWFNWLYVILFFCSNVFLPS